MDQYGGWDQYLSEITDEITAEFTVKEENLTRKIKELEDLRQNQERTIDAIREDTRLMVQELSASLVSLSNFVLSVPFSA